MALAARAAWRADNIIILIAFATFIGLGLSSGLRGVAWPSMRDEFGLPTDGLGVLIFAQTMGYIVSSFFSGRVMRVLGNGRMYMISTVVMGLGLLASFAAPSWPVFVGAGFVIGSASGLVDAGLNNYVAAHYGARQMNWLHACFGVGTTIGPLVMTTILNASLPWRVGYGLSGGLVLLLALLYVVTLRRWDAGSRAPTSANTGVQAALGQTLRLPLMWLSILLFGVYAGLEIGAGDWSYSLFTEGRGIAPEIAGMWVTIYWGSFTVARMLFGFISGRFGLIVLLRLCMIGTLAGTALWWWNPTQQLGFIGLGLLGFAQAPLFPLLTLGTARRLGAQHAANAIGFQISAAGLGIALLPALAGALVARMGYEVITPYFLVLAILVFILHELTLFFSRGRLPQVAAQGAD